MVISQKGRYAVRCVLELSKQDEDAPVTTARIAFARYIPVRFLENILVQLRQALIVESVRGKSGGYRLRRPPEDITVGEVIRAIEGELEEVDCRGQSEDGSDCLMKSGCVLLPVWQEAHGAMMAVFDRTTFADLLEQERTACGSALEYSI